MKSVLNSEESLPLDQAAAAKALEALQPLLGELDTVADDYADSMPASTGEWAAEAIDEWDDGDGEVNFVQGLLMSHMLAGRLWTVSQEGDAVVQQADEAQVTPRHGNLRVGGSLTLHAPLMVLGDLDAEGRVMDLVRASRLIVTGSLRCKTLRIGSPVWVAGRVEADAICFDPGGQLWTGEGLQAYVVVGSAQSRGVIHGDVMATYYIASDRWNADGHGAYSALADALVPDAMVRSDSKIGYFQPEGLLALVEAGKPYLRK
jgi:hypothetical protein